MDFSAFLPQTSALTPQIGFGVVIAVGAVVLFALACAGLFGEAQTRRIMNRRLKFKEKTESTAELIVELRRQRALDEDGNFRLAVKWFNRLVLRSGLVFKPVQWAIGAIVAGLVIGGLIYWRLPNLPIAGFAGALVALAAPIFVLKYIAGSRAKALAKQLPDALQIVVRSLEAGHPVPGAIALVAREMPDPIGTEFGMAADEMAYGFSLTKAVERMANRAGDPDIDLFAATVRLQERTGGNLCDLLKTNASTVRERQTLRLKVKAASAEGRASALILTAAPFVVMSAVHLLRPEFYGLVAGEKLFKYCMVGFGVWMLIGNVIMNRMINFRF
ncbi:MAG: type II secretion system F family protein [Pseudomonadota bacterium]